MGQDGCANTFSLDCALKALGIGLGVGLLTGFFGVGGGFLIVPALLFIMGFPPQMAIGTSLLIMALISIGGIIGHLKLAQIDFVLTALIIGGSFVGMLAGTRIGQSLDQHILQRAFASIAGGTGLFLLIDNGIRMMG